MSDRYERIAEIYRRWDDSDFEHEERVRKAMDQANWLFNRVTQPQQVALNCVIANLRGDNSPRAIRFRKRAYAVYDEATAPAEELRFRAFRDCMRIDDISPETGEAFDALLRSDALDLIRSDIRKISQGCEV